MPKFDTALVFYDNEKAGTLRKTILGYEFQYDLDYMAKPDAMPVSLALPLQNEKYESKTLFPFFEGLLPEGWLLELLTSKLKIDKNDKFALLLRAGVGTVGAVTVRPINEESDE